MLKLTFFNAKGKLEHSFLVSEHGSNVIAVTWLSKSGSWKTLALIPCWVALEWIDKSSPSSLTDKKTK